MVLQNKQEMKLASQTMIDISGQAYEQIYWDIGGTKLDFKMYQELGQVTANQEMDFIKRLSVAGLGIAGEAGEVAELIKKHIGRGHELSVSEVIKELGDVLWYIQEIAYLIGSDIEEVAILNIDKLKKRYPEGFSTERSVNRAE